mmetsp:Transcript_9865/g.22189  ORF Transcript_9865/g.22189 Transcript_9865/m.22189 type:complete len:737 (+) Transcript_9865:240-2450(+)
MNAEEDFQRCIASRRRQSSRRLTTPSTIEEIDPMDAERETIWNEVDSELRNSVPNAGNNTSLMSGDIPQIPEPEYMGDEKEVHGYTQFHALCALPRNGPMDPNWQNVRQYLSSISHDGAEKVPSSTQKEGFNYTPLHVVCFLSPPVDIVQHIIRLNKKSVRIVSNHGDTPLGLACGGFVPAGGDVIQELVKAYPEARDETNSRNESPLHIYLKTRRNYELDPCPYMVKMLATVDAVNTRDVKDHSPLYYLGRAATEAFSLMAMCVRFFSTEEDSGPDFDNFKKCLYIIVSLNPARASKTLFLRDLLQLPANLRDLSFEKKGTREVINSIVGRGQYIALLMMDFYVQLSIVVAFTLGCSDTFQKESYTTVTIVGSVYWLLRRLASATGSSEKWTKVNAYHLMTLVQAIMLLVSSIYLRNNGMNLMSGSPWRNILIANSVFIWMTMMGIVCHTMKGFSVFVHATVQIFKKLFNLFLVFLIIFVCFSTMFFLSAVDSSTGYCAADPEEPGEYLGDYCSLQDAMEKVYSLFFGTLEATDFDVPGPTLVTLFFFNIIVIIMLLNIIIAVMSDCYADVSGHAELVFWDHRFELIQDVDATTNCITSLFSCFCTNREKKPKMAHEEAQDVSAMSHEWFSNILHFKKSTKLLPKPLANLLTFLVMALWVLSGLCTLGITWPRHARRKVFAPSVSDHLLEDESELEMEIEKMKENNQLLEENNSKLNEENEALKKKLDALQNKPP